MVMCVRDAPRRMGLAGLADAAAQPECKRRQSAVTIHPPSFRVLLKVAYIVARRHDVAATCERSDGGAGAGQGGVRGGRWGPAEKADEQKAVVAIDRGGVEWRGATPA